MRSTREDGALPLTLRAERSRAGVRASSTTTTTTQAGATRLQMSAPLAATVLVLDYSKIEIYLPFYLFYSSIDFCFR